MGAFLAMFDPVARIIEHFIPDKSAQDAAKAALAQSMASGDIAQKLAEIQGATQIITAEAQSQSWIARNVRPLLLLMWGSVITVNFVAPIIARFWLRDFQPLALDPWVYKLTAIGYTGYVGFRSWEKVQDADK